MLAGAALGAGVLFCVVPVAAGLGTEVGFAVLGAFAAGFGAGAEGFTALAALVVLSEGLRADAEGLAVPAVPAVFETGLEADTKGFAALVAFSAGFGAEGFAVFTALAVFAAGLEAGAEGFAALVVFSAGFGAGAEGFATLFVLAAGFGAGDCGAVVSTFSDTAGFTARFVWERAIPLKSFRSLFSRSECPESVRILSEHSEAAAFALFIIPSICAKS